MYFCSKPLSCRCNSFRYYYLLTAFVLHNSENANIQVARNLSISTLANYLIIKLACYALLL